MKMAKSITGEIVKLRNVRLSFPTLDVAKAPASFPNAEKAFNATFLIDPKEQRALIEAVNKSIAVLRNEAWKLGGKPHPKEETKGFPFGKGDTKVNDAGEIYKGYEGMYFVSARNKNQPILLDKFKAELTDPAAIAKVFYGGCYVNANINFWVQDNAYGKAIRCGLRGVQFVKDGDAFGGGRASVNEFDDVEEPDGLDELDDLFDDDIPY
jgi:hypothetical protein